jgi:alkanesulfonate monooxygenase SsuD/methylene tetrahydromethanopterin reductase-like flavin-dependent oxidoreductase (luciferase family)
VPRIALHCSHEQIPPSRLLQSIQRAEEAGFDGGMSSDHFAPWSSRQGESGFAWSFLGAALATTTLPFGVPLRAVPVAAVDRARDRRGVQRAHHRRALAAEGRAHGAAA